MSQRITTYALLTLAFVAVLYSSSIFKSHSYLENARALATKGELMNSAKEYRNAISWRSPGNWYANQAIIELQNASNQTAIPSDQKILLLQELKRGLLSSRSFWFPEDSKDPNTLSGQVTLELDRLNNTSISEHVREEFPAKQNYLIQLLSNLFFWLWIGACLLTCWKGMNKEGEIIWKSLIPGLVSSSILYLFWIIALDFA